MLNYIEYNILFNNIVFLLFFLDKFNKLDFLPDIEANVSKILEPNI